MPTVNFYTKAGRMYGFDLHDFHAMILTPAAPLPAMLPLTPYFVVAPFAGPSNFQHTPSVTNGGWNMVISNFDVYFVPHVPASLFPPGPLQAVNWTLIELLSGTEVLFGQDTVTAGGEDTSIALAGAFGLNVNCSDPFDHLLGATYNPNTVQTFVSAGKLLGALVGYVVVTAISLGLQSLVKSRINGLKVPCEKEAIKEYADAAAELVAAPGEKAIGWVAKELLPEGLTKALSKHLSEEAVEELSEKIPEAIASHIVRVSPLVPGGDWLNALLNPFDPTGTNQGYVAEQSTAALGALGLE